MGPPPDAAAPLEARPSSRTGSRPLAPERPYVDMPGGLWGQALVGGPSAADADGEADRAQGREADSAEAASAEAASAEAAVSGVVKDELGDDGPQGDAGDGLSIGTSERQGPAEAAEDTPVAADARASCSRCLLCPAASASCCSKQCVFAPVSESDFRISLRLLGSCSSCTATSCSRKFGTRCGVPSVRRGTRECDTMRCQQDVNMRKAPLQCWRQ